MGMVLGETSGDRGAKGVRREPVAAVTTLTSAAYAEHGDALRAYLARFTRDLANAEDLVHDTFAHLPKDARAALLLSADGYSSAEIAQRIGRSELATRAMLSRQRSRLRTIVAA